MKILGLIITTKSREEKKLKEVYLRGLYVGDGIRCQTRKLDESQRGIILSGINVEKECEEILEREGW